MKMLELLLMKDVSTLGSKGDIIKVKNGYARNYLIPKGIAATVTKESLRLLEVEKKKVAQKELAQKEELKNIAKELEVTACMIEAKANDEQHLFGSVTYSIIAEHYQKLGFDVKADEIELEDSSMYPIKELGIFAVQIRLHPEVVAKSKVWVTPEQENEE